MGITTRMAERYRRRAGGVVCVGGATWRFEPRVTTRGGCTTYAKKNHKVPTAMANLKLCTYVCGGLMTAYP